MNEILQDNGGNQYSIPHIGKDHLERVGSLPNVMPVTPAAAQYEKDEASVEV